MANDIRMQDPRLRDPINNISDGLKDPTQDNTPGFFQSLRNPYHLILEESLPASLYQWITGNTKKKQAEEALRFIQNNPDLKDTKLYKTAERKLQRFGYLLDEGPMSIDFKEVGNMIKKNPKLFGAELVNMLMADPWLMAMPLGWGKLGRGVVNSIKLRHADKLKWSKQKIARKTGEAVDDLKVGGFATLATPFVFSSVWQLSEDRTMEAKRTTVETTIGATAGALFSVGFAGMGELASRMTRSPRALTNQAIDKILKDNAPDLSKTVRYNKKGFFNSVDDLIEEIKKQQKDIDDPVNFERIKADITVALRQLNENAKDASIATNFKVAASLAGIGATAQFLTADDEKLMASAKGAAVGASIWGAGKLFMMAGAKAKPAYDQAALSTEAALDTMKLITVKLNTAAVELSNVVKLNLPDAIDSRRKIFYYLAGARGTWDKKASKFIPDNTKPRLDQVPKFLNKREMDGAIAIRKTFDKFYDIFGNDAGLITHKRRNYLPLLWNQYNPKDQAFKFMSDYDAPLQKVTGPSEKFQFGRSSTFRDINRGFRKGYTIREGFDDPAELIKIYGFAASKAMATRALIKNLEFTKVNNRPLMYRTMKGRTYADDQNYTKFQHPYFDDGGEQTVFVHKGMINSLKMIFDAREEQALMGALFTTNLMMKRLAVGFSFFHAGALVESMLFAGTKWNSVKQILNPRAKPEILKMINDPKHHMKEYGHAIKRLKRHGYNDVVRFAQGTGLQISVPEDVGFDRFYYNIRGIDTFLKSHFGISTGGKTEKVFRWFDKITWDRVFTAAKLHTFMTVLNNPTKMGVKNPMAIMPRDNHATIYRKATQAAQFTNDAFGGQNWEMIANRIQTPLLKRMMQTTFQPGSRGYMQLLLFAPDWTISNVRIIAKSLPAFESDPALRRMYQYYFARAALTYAAAGSILNEIFSGKSLLENTDPTRIDLGNGEVLTFSKQLMEPFHWITDPQSTGLKKIGSLPRTTIEVLTNKQYLTTKWSPNITKKDDEAIEKGLKLGGHVGMRFLPIWLQTASRSIAEGLEKDGLSADLAADVAVDFVLGQSGHPRYQGPRYTQYKTKGLVRSPYETLF